uniref:GDP-fucose protein O-fucosyltransferase 2 n=1 Tax=Culex pipiens TaxID=7175 RepID=A0A8D8JPF0_CULPI
MKSKWPLVALVCLFLRTEAIDYRSWRCEPYEFFLDFYRCCSESKLSERSESSWTPTTYVLYEVNPSEGFNLRRDVYIRMAVFMRGLRRMPGWENTKLVLPPWSELHHWRSNTINQRNLTWGHFFDLESMRKFTEVIEAEQFFREFERWSTGNGRHEARKAVSINEYYRLTHFDDMFENGVFVDKFEQTPCTKALTKDAPGFMRLHATFEIDEFYCVRFQGAATLLYSMFKKFGPEKQPEIRTIFVGNAEVVLHDHWGNVDYWEARRSMRFSKTLVSIADEFRLHNFNSSNERDRVQRPASWTDERPYRKAKGGDFLCAHLRRADFLYGRDKTTPTLHSAAAQIKKKLLELGLRKVYISSDCPGMEFNDLKNYLRRFKVVRFTPESRAQMDQLKDGGVAIIDQIICSQARYFIGTYESTFTYRIYEEREILGFPRDLTFNTFCKHEEATNCEKNAVWPIQYE